MCNISNFHNDNFNIRTLLINDVTWFVAVDITNSLGYSNNRKAIKDHVDIEDKNTVTIRDGIGNPNKIVINESGLYSLILSSKLPTAKEFKRWITSEVLPSIRKTGSYSLKESEYLEFGSEEFPMNWLYEHSNIIEVYSKNSLKSLNKMEEDIKEFKNKLKSIQEISKSFKKNSGNHRFNSRLVKYDRHQQLNID